MGKKILALLAIGAAAYLLKTKKGTELRRNLGNKAGELKDKLMHRYHSNNGKAAAS